MSQELITQLREQLFQLERRIKPLEWDAGRNQINEFKKLELVRLQAEHQELWKKLQDLEQKKDQVMQN